MERLGRKGHLFLIPDSLPVKFFLTSPRQFLEESIPRSKEVGGVQFWRQRCCCEAETPPPRRRWSPSSPLLPAPSPPWTTRRHPAKGKCHCRRPSPPLPSLGSGSRRAQRDLRPHPPAGRAPARPSARPAWAVPTPPNSRGPARSSPAPSPSDVAGAEGAQGRRRRRRQTRSSSESVKSVSFFLFSEYSEVVLNMRPRDPHPVSRSHPSPPYPEAGAEGGGGKKRRAKTPLRAWSWATAGSLLGGMRLSLTG